MSGEDYPRDRDVDETNLRLEEGLKNCREILAAYRARIECTGQDNEYPDSNAGIQEQA